MKRDWLTLRSWAELSPAEREDEFAWWCDYLNNRLPDRHGDNRSYLAAVRVD